MCMQHSAPPGTLAPLGRPSRVERLLDKLKCLLFAPSSLLRCSKDVVLRMEFLSTPEVKASGLNFVQAGLLGTSWRMLCRCARRTALLITAMPCWQAFDPPTPRMAHCPAMTALTPAAPQALFRTVRVSVLVGLGMLAVAIYLKVDKVGRDGAVLSGARSCWHGRGPCVQLLASTASLPTRPHGPPRFPRAHVSTPSAAHPNNYCCTCCLRVHVSTRCCAAQQLLPERRDGAHCEHLLRRRAAARPAGRLGLLLLARLPVSRQDHGATLVRLAGVVLLLRHATCCPSCCPCEERRISRCLLLGRCRGASIRPPCPCPSSNLSGKRWSHRRKRAVTLAGVEVRAVLACGATTTRHGKVQNLHRLI